MFISDILVNDSIVAMIFFFLATIGTIFECIGIWKSVENKDRVWFVVFILIRTLGVLPIIYLFRKKYFSENKKYNTIAVQALFVYLLLLVALIFYTIY